MTRTASLQRKTHETEIELILDLDGSGTSDVHTGVGFFDHMLELLSRHSLIDLRVAAKGDLEVDQHHTVEDVGICFGSALAEALGAKEGIRRYGSITLPMEETLVTAAVDLSGRAHFVWQVPLPVEKIGDFDAQLIEDFWQAASANGRFNLHVLLHHGNNGHHVAEGVFKGIARALREAVEPDSRQAGIPSTKGTL